MMFLFDIFFFFFYVFILILFFFFNDTATTEIYTLSLHDALPISRAPRCCRCSASTRSRGTHPRSEEHTSELQSRQYLVCRLLLEKKKKKKQKLVYNKKKQYKKKKKTKNNKQKE